MRTAVLSQPCFRQLNPDQLFFEMQKKKQGKCAPGGSGKNEINLKIVRYG